MVLRRIGVWSLARMMGLLYAGLGVIIGAVFGLFALAGAGLVQATDSDEPAFIRALFGAGALVIFPVFYGLLGLVFGALTAALYNLIAGKAGGVVIDLEPASPANP